MGRGEFQQTTLPQPRDSVPTWEKEWDDAWDDEWRNSWMYMEHSSWTAAKEVAKKAAKEHAGEAARAAARAATRAAVSRAAARQSTTFSPKDTAMEAAMEGKIEHILRPSHIRSQRNKTFYDSNRLSHYSPSSRTSGPSLSYGSDVTPETASLSDFSPFTSIGAWRQTTQAFPEGLTVTESKLPGRNTVNNDEFLDEYFQHRFLRPPNYEFQYSYGRRLSEPCHASYHRSATIGDVIFQESILNAGRMHAEDVALASGGCSEQEISKVSDYDFNCAQNSVEPFNLVHPHEAAAAQNVIAQESIQKCSQKDLFCAGPTHFAGSAVQSEGVTRAHKTQNDEEPHSPPHPSSKGPQDPPDLSPNCRPLEELVPWKDLAEYKGSGSSSDKHPSSAYRRSNDTDYDSGISPSLSREDGLDAISFVTSPRPSEPEDPYPLLLPQFPDVTGREELFDWLIVFLRAITSSRLSSNHGSPRAAAHDHAGTAGFQPSQGAAWASSSPSELGATITNRKRPRNATGGSTFTEPEVCHSAKKAKLNKDRLFACPFHQRRPFKYCCKGEAGDFRSCASPGFPEIQRVKDHILKQHLQPIHCDMCGRVFSTETQVSRHRQQRECPATHSPLFVAQLPSYDGLNKDQEKMLREKKRIGRHGKCEESDAAHWHRMDGICHPNRGQDRRSPYYINHLQDYGHLLGVYDPIQPLISPEASSESNSSNRLAAIVRSAVNSLTVEQLGWERGAIADTLLDIMSQTLQAELDQRPSVRQALPTPSVSLNLTASSSVSLGWPDSSPTAPRSAVSGLQPAFDEPVQPTALAADTSNPTFPNAPQASTSTSNSVPQPRDVLEQLHNSTELPGDETNNAAILSGSPDMTQFFDTNDIATANDYEFDANMFPTGIWDGEVMSGFSENG